MANRPGWKATAEGDCAVYEHTSGWEVWWRMYNVPTKRYIAIGPNEIRKPIDKVGKRFDTLKEAIEYCEEQAAKTSNQPPTTQAKE